MASITTSAIDLESAYAACETLAKTHYENFPVASRLLPKAIRRPIAVIYAFARQADDIADEGILSPPERLKQLQQYSEALVILQNNGSVTEPLFIALQDVLKQYPNLPITLLFDLLQAFKQDVIKKRYHHFSEVLEYCHYSANPVGRLLLHLRGEASEENLIDSDAICTALQLINFLQDLNDDLLHRDRCYLPTDEMHALEVTIDQLMLRQKTGAIHQLIQNQLQRIERLLDQGSPLGKRLTGSFGFEVRLIIASGYKILNALKDRQDPYYRPKIRTWNCPEIFWKALFPNFNLF